MFQIHFYLFTHCNVFLFLTFLPCDPSKIQHLLLQILNGFLVTLFAPYVEYNIMELNFLPSALRDSRKAFKIQP